MRVLIILAAFFSIYCITVIAQEIKGDAAAGAAKAKGCIACHNTMVSLKGRGADVIANQINAIREGDKAHPPGLAELNEEDIVDIATYLDGA